MTTQTSPLRSFVFTHEGGASLQCQESSLSRIEQIRPATSLCLCPGQVRSPTKFLVCLLDRPWSLVMHETHSPLVLWRPRLNFGRYYPSPSRRAFQTTSCVVNLTRLKTCTTYRSLSEKVFSSSIDYSFPKSSRPRTRRTYLLRPLQYSPVGKSLVVVCRTLDLNYNFRYL